MKKRGCGYIAAANAIFAEFGNLSDEEWFKIFGFEKRNENGELNINYLFLDIFLYYNNSIPLCVQQKCIHKNEIKRIMRSHFQGHENIISYTGVNLIKVMQFY